MLGGRHPRRRLPPFAGGVEACTRLAQATQGEPATGLAQTMNMKQLCERRSSCTTRASPTCNATSWTSPSPPSPKPSGSTRKMPRPTAAEGTPTTARAILTRPSPITLNLSASLRDVPAAIGCVGLSTKKGGRRPRPIRSRRAWDDPLARELPTMRKTLNLQQDYPANHNTQ